MCGHLKYWRWISLNGNNQTQETAQVEANMSVAHNILNTQTVLDTEWDLAMVA